MTGWASWQPWVIGSIAATLILWYVYRALFADRARGRLAGPAAQARVGPIGISARGPGGTRACRVGRRGEAAARPTEGLSAADVHPRQRICRARRVGGASCRTRGALPEKPCHFEGATTILTARARADNATHACTLSRTTAPRKGGGMGARRGSFCVGCFCPLRAPLTFITL